MDESVPKPNGIYSLRGVLTAVVALRALVFIVGVLSIHFAKPTDLNQPAPGLPELATGRPWLAFDGVHYKYLAEHGYPALGDPLPVVMPAGARIPPYIAFFPAYPLASRWLGAGLSLLVGKDDGLYLAMLSISNLATLIGAGFLFDWMRRLTAPRTAFIATLLACAYPGAVFFSAALTEASFFMCTAIAFWMLQSRKPYHAAIASAFASVLRPTCVAVAAVIALWALLRKPTNGIAGHIAKHILIGCLAVSGLIAYEIYLTVRYETPTAYLTVQKYWEPSASKNPTQTPANTPTNPQPAPSSKFAKLLQPSVWNRPIWMALALVAFIGIFKPGPIPRVYFWMPLIIIAITWGPGLGTRSSSIGRFLSPALPCFGLLAFWLDRQKARLWIVPLILLALTVQLYYAWLFSRGFWVG